MYDCMTVCFPVSQVLSIHLHILMRWSQRSNSRLWSHRMPASCVCFPLFVSPWPRSYMEAQAASCRPAQGGRHVSNYRPDAGLNPLSLQATRATTIYDTKVQAPHSRDPYGMWSSSLSPSLKQKNMSRSYWSVQPAAAPCKNWVNKSAPCTLFE